MKRAWDTTGNDVTATFQSWIASADYFAMAELYQIVLPFGPTFGLTFLEYTDADVDLTWQGRTYTALSTRVSRGHRKEVVGVEVDTLNIYLASWVDGALVTLPGSPLTLPAAARAGLFDGGFVTVWRLFFGSPPQWHVAPDIKGGVKLFVGYVGEATVDRERITLRVKSPLDRLHLQLPKNVFQASCLNTLYDAVCGISPGATGPQGLPYAFTSTVNGPLSTTMTLILRTVPPHYAGFFDLGFVMLSDVTWSFGIRRTIKSHTIEAVPGAGFPAVIRLVEPMPYTLDDNQGVLLQAGCDKSLETCILKFNNRARFRGFPYIPTPETAL